MCGRYTNEAEFSQIRLVFDAQDATFRPWQPVYNISPSYTGGYEQPFVVADGKGGRELRLGRWWLIPHWWKKPLSKLPTAFNARAEDLTEKPMWKTAFERTRCLVPATGWREFMGDRSPKQPYHFQPVRPSFAGNHPGKELFAFAGLRSRWVSPEGEVVDSFAIVTTDPSPEAARIHDRMPLVLPASSYDAWLASSADARAVLDEARVRARSLPLEIFPTNPVANNSRFEGPEAIEPVEPV